jgi:branched-subunit amino acid transport protein
MVKVGHRILETPSIVQIIIGSAVVTFLPRVVPILILAGRRMARPLERWLGYVPAALLGALLIASLQAKPGDLSLWGLDTRDVLAALPAGIVAVRTRSIMLTVVVGILAAFLTRQFIPAY